MKEQLPIVSIRPATIDDVDGIADVHIEAWKTAYRDILPSDFLENLSLETKIENWQGILSRANPVAFTFVAEVDGRIIGFANGGPERTGDADFAGELYSIYLLERYHRLGIGSDLFRRCAQALHQRGMNSMKVWALKDNPCRSFYERHGGQLVCEQPVMIGQAMLSDVAYGWRQLETIPHQLPTP